MCRLHFFAVVVAVLSTVNNSLQRSSVSSPDYVAAVVEYNPASSGDIDIEIYNNNVDIYQSIIENATRRADPADIIVFPEVGLVTYNRRVFTVVPRPDALIVPCTDTSGRYDNLRQISCAARDNEVYVVINLWERFPCPIGETSEYEEPCPEDEAFHYNTNVAFDRTGAVVARYRKFHLFAEDGIVPPPLAELSTFVSDFGVKFGLFTCFDLMFDQPAIQLVKQQNITDLIFPTAWFSELPFLTAVQAQASFAYLMDVNLLGSGYNEPTYGSGGSGIYVGRQRWDYVMPAEATTQLLVSRVPKKNFNSGGRQQLNDAPASVTTLTSRVTSGIYMKQDDLSAYKSVLIVSNQTNERVCYNTFCCDFDIVADLSSGHKYFYRMFAFDGVRTFTGVATGGVQICSVVFCTDSDQASCGKTLDDAEMGVATTFTSISVKGGFNAYEAAQYPNTLVPMYQIVPPDEFTFTQEMVEDKNICEMKLLKETKILTFGIFGREFTRDGLDVTKPSGGSCLMPVIAALSLTVVAIALSYN